jgi:hypothetical protein
MTLLHTSSKPIHISEPLLAIGIAVELMAISVLIFWRLELWIISGLKGLVRNNAYWFSREDA